MMIVTRSPDVLSDLSSGKSEEKERVRGMSGEKVRLQVNDTLFFFHRLFPLLLFRLICLYFQTILKKTKGSVCCISLAVRLNPQLGAALLYKCMNER